MTPHVMAQTYQGGFVLTQFQGIYKVIYFISVEVEFGHNVVACFDSEDEAEACFKELTK